MSWETREFKVPGEIVTESRGVKGRIFDWIEEHHPVVVARTVGWSGRWVPGAPTAEVTVRVRPNRNHRGAAA